MKMVIRSTNNIPDAKILVARLSEHPRFAGLRQSNFAAGSLGCHQGQPGLGEEKHEFYL